MPRETAQPSIMAHRRRPAWAFAAPAGRRGRLLPRQDASAWWSAPMPAAATTPMPAPSRSICAGTSRASRPSSCRTCRVRAAWWPPTGSSTSRQRTALTLLLHQRGIPFHPYFGEKSAKFVPTEFNWLGSFNSETGITAMWHTAKVKTFEDVFKETAVLGGQWAERQRNLSVADEQHDRHQVPDRLGLQIEHHCAAGDGARRGRRRRRLVGVAEGEPAAVAAEKQVNLIVQVGRIKHPDLPDVPMVLTTSRSPSTARCGT